VAAQLQVLITAHIQSKKEPGGKNEIPGDVAEYAGGIQKQTYEGAPKRKRR